MSFSASYYKQSDQFFRCYENNHASSHKLYVSHLGNIERSGFFIYYSLPGVDLQYWKEIPFAEFTSSARPEAIALIEFINKYNRLPAYILNKMPYGYR